MALGRTERLRHERVQLREDNVPKPQAGSRLRELRESPSPGGLRGAGRRVFCGVTLMGKRPVQALCPSAAPPRL